MKRKFYSLIAVLFCSMVVFTLTACAPTYTLTFASNDGSYVPIQILRAGQHIDFPEDPVKENHTFLGWYLDEYLTIKAEIEYMPMADTTLYARWEYTIVTVTFSTLCDVYLNPIRIEVQKTIQQPEVSYSDHLLVGWYVDDKIISFPYKVTRNVNLTARWLKTPEYKAQLLIDAFADVPLGFEDYNIKSSEYEVNAAIAEVNEMDAYSFALKNEIIAILANSGIDYYATVAKLDQYVNFKYRYNTFINDAKKLFGTNVESIEEINNNTIEAHLELADLKSRFDAFLPSHQQQIIKYVGVTASEMDDFLEIIGELDVFAQRKIEDTSKVPTDFAIVKSGSKSLISADRPIINELLERLAEWSEFYTEEQINEVLAPIGFNFEKTKAILLNHLEIISAYESDVLIYVTDINKLLNLLPEIKDLAESDRVTVVALQSILHVIKIDRGGRQIVEIGETLGLTINELDEIVNALLGHLNSIGLTSAALQAIVDQLPSNYRDATIEMKETVASFNELYAEIHEKFGEEQVKSLLANVCLGNRTFDETYIYITLSLDHHIDHLIIETLTIGNLIKNLPADPLELNYIDHLRIMRDLVYLVNFIEHKYTEVEFASIVRNIYYNGELVENALDKLAEYDAIISSQEGLKIEFGAFDFIDWYKLVNKDTKDLLYADFGVLEDMVELDAAMKAVNDMTYEYFVYIAEISYFNLETEITYEVAFADISYNYYYLMALQIFIEKVNELVAELPTSTSLLSFSDEYNVHTLKYNIGVLESFFTENQVLEAYGILSESTFELDKARATLYLDYINSLHFYATAISSLIENLPAGISGLDITHARWVDLLVKMEQVMIGKGFTQEQILELTTEVTYFGEEVEYSCFAKYVEAMAVITDVLDGYREALVGALEALDQSDVTIASKELALEVSNALAAVEGLDDDCQAYVLNGVGSLDELYELINAWDNAVNQYSTDISEWAKTINRYLNGYPVLPSESIELLQSYNDFLEATYSVSQLNELAELLVLEEELESFAQFVELIDLL